VMLIAAFAILLALNGLQIWMGKRR
jgi:hypothetical protein